MPGHRGSNCTRGKNNSPIAQPLGEQPSGGRQAICKRGRRQLQFARNFPLRPATEIAKYHGDAEFFGQASQFLIEHGLQVGPSILR